MPGGPMKRQAGLSRRHATLAAGAVLGLGAGYATLRPTAGEPLEDERLRRLRAGVNLSHWYAIPLAPGRPRTTPGFIEVIEFARIRQAGFRHVRLPVDPLYLWERPWTLPVSLSSSAHGSLRRSLDAILAADLAAIVNIHPADSAFSARIFAPGGPALFVEFWAALSRALRDTDPNRVVLEFLNEPGLGSAPAWPDLQGEIIRAARAEAARHTFVVSGANWSTIGDLLALRPYDDRNLVYNFHHYEPMLFTHQGATWAGQPGRLRGVPYPASRPPAELPAGRQRISARPRQQAIRRGSRPRK